MISPETLEKYQELQELFEEIASPEMKQAMSELQEALENIDPQQIQEALEKMEFNQESFLKNIERTIELFKRLRVEQKFDEIINKAEELAQQQEELNESAKDAPQTRQTNLRKNSKHCLQKTNN